MQWAVRGGMVRWCSNGCTQQGYEHGSLRSTQGLMRSTQHSSDNSHYGLSTLPVCYSVVETSGWADMHGWAWAGLRFAPRLMM